MKTAWAKRAACAALALFAALVWVPAAFAESVEYLGEDGKTYTQENVTQLTANDATWGTAGGETWYVASGTVEIGSRVTVAGDVHLILANGAALTVNGGIEVGEGNSFTVYAQTTGSDMGSLEAKATGTGDGAGIGGNNGQYNNSNGYTSPGGTAGSITIHGGKVTATGAGAAAGIGGGAGSNGGSGGTVRITGGVVTATGGTVRTYSGAGIGGGYYGGDGGTVTITGGVVKAQGGNNTYGSAGIGGGVGGSGGTVNITGGQVTATGGAGSNGGAGIGGGYNGSSGGSFSVSGESTVVTASSVSDQAGKTNGTWQGIVYEGSTGRVYGRVELGRNFTNEANYTLNVPSAGALTILSGVTFTNEGALNIAEGGTLTNNGALANSGTLTNNGALANNGTLTNSGTVYQMGTYAGTGATGNGTWIEGENTQYLLVDKQGNSESKSHVAVPVKNTDTAWGIAGGEIWYVAKDTVEITGRVKVTGSVHLILADGAKLTVSEGIEVGAGNSFTVYAQTKEETQMGSLVATATDDSDSAGIGGGRGGSGGTVTVYGGVVNAMGGGNEDMGGAGIGGGYGGSGGTVAVYGGVVNATGGICSAGIGGDESGSGGTVTVYGGVVKATGGGGNYSGAGIGGGGYGSSGGTVAVYGGVVTATGGDGGNYSGAGIGGGGYRGNGGEVTIAGGKVTATGGNNAAGIGGGNGGTVNITGGDVTATGKSGGSGIGGGLTISPAEGWNIQAKAGESAAAATALSGSPFAPGTTTDVTAQVQGKAYFATVAQKLPDKETPAQSTGSTQKQNPKTGV